jgi:hypothetical protein
LPKPNYEDLPADFRIPCTAKHRRISLQGAVPNTEDATMKSLSTKLVLSALGFALLAGPAVAQKPADQYLANQYLADQYKVVVRGQIVGADPDAQIRTQLSREWDFRYGE